MFDDINLHNTVMIGLLVIVGFAVFRIGRIYWMLGRFTRHVLFDQIVVVVALAGLTVRFMRPVDESSGKRALAGPVYPPRRA